MYSQPLGKLLSTTCEYFGNVKFDVGQLHQGQTMAGQHKSVYISCIIGSRGLQCTVSLKETISFESFDCVRFDLGPLLQGQIMVD